MTKLEDKFGEKLSSQAARFSDALRAHTDEAISSAKMQENEALDQRITWVTDELMDTLRERLLVAAQAGKTTCSICYMYVEGYTPDEFRSFHQPHEVAAQFGEAMRTAVMAQYPDLEVSSQVYSWGQFSAYPEVLIRW